MLALCLDTETTGIAENRTIKVDRLPELIEFYGCVADLSDGAIQRELHHLIKPSRLLSDKPNPGDKKTTSEITGITNEMLQDAPSFAAVADEIIAFVEQAPLVIAHNASFDREILDIETARLGRLITWPRVLCSVEQTVHLKGKRLGLGVLHEYLFGMKFDDAHRAKADVQALVRCCTELFKRGEL